MKLKLSNIKENKNKFIPIKIIGNIELNNKDSKK